MGRLEFRPKGTLGFKSSPQSQSPDLESQTDTEADEAVAPARKKAHTSTKRKADVVQASAVPRWVSSSDKSSGVMTRSMKKRKMALRAATAESSGPAHNHTTGDTTETGRSIPGKLHEKRIDLPSSQALTLLARPTRKRPTTANLAHSAEDTTTDLSLFVSDAISPIQGSMDVDVEQREETPVRARVEHVANADSAVTRLDDGDSTFNYPNDLSDLDSEED